MIERLPKFFVNRPTLFWSIIVGILAYGVLSYLRMPKLEDPAVPIKQLSVMALYPGADVDQMELKVAVPLEDALRTLPDVNKLKTDITPGRVMIGVEFAKELPMTEIEQHFDMARRKVNDATLRLPQGVTPIVIDDMMDVYGLLYAFYGEGYTYKELEKYAKLLRRELLTVPGVKRINIGGTQSEVIEVEFTPEFIKANGLIPLQLMSDIQQATGIVDAGQAAAGDYRLTMHVTDAIETVRDIESLLVNTPDGKKVRVGDIATVKRKYTEPRSNSVYIDGEPAVTIAITLENSAIVPDVGKDVGNKLQQTMQRFPVGMTTEKIFFQPDKVEEAISGFMINLLESVLIVVVILMFAMGWRAGVIIGFGLILTVALSFPILAACGTTLQRISLGAFIVAMGMLVDNSVVIMDGILADRDRGLQQNKFLYRIVGNTAMPLLGATIIAACTFLPIYITPGTAGEFAGDLFVVIFVSLMASWFLALVQVPFCAKSWIGKNKNVGETKIDIYTGPVYRIMKKILQWIIGHRITSIVAAIGLLMAAFAGIAKIKSVFFPDFDYRQFVVECYFNNMNNADSVDNRIRELADSVRALETVDRVIVSTGGAPARYCLVRPMPSGGSDYAELIVDCKDFKTMLTTTDMVREKLRAIAPDAYIRTRKYNFSISSSHTVEVEFTGPDKKILRELARQAEDIMRQSKYVDPYSVQNNWRPASPTLEFEFSQVDAQRAGISRSDVGNALKAATDGYTVGVVYEGDNIIPINLTVRNADGSRIKSLASAPVWTMMNVNTNPEELKGLITGATNTDKLTREMFRTTVIGNVVDSSTVIFSDEYLYRYNGQRAIQAEADPDPLNPEATPAKVLADISDKIADIDVPDGYTMRYVGEMDTSGEATDTLVGFLPMIIMMVFVVLLLLFNNWKKIFVIILCFPFVMCGIVPLLLLTDTPFTFIAIIGCMGLIGMMVKNAIVLVDEINRLQTEEHIEPRDSVLQATLSRVRPVMLASFTTILGMIPLISDAMYGSLAVTVIGGLFVGTIVTLMILPLFYSLFFNITSK